jgi:hypothetical protein
VADIRYDHRFEPIDEHHTRLAWTVVAKRPRMGLLGRAFAAGYGRNLNSGHPQPAARAGWSRALASRRLVAISRTSHVG